MRGLLLCAAVLVFGATAAKADLYEYTYTGNDLTNTPQSTVDNYLSISFITSFLLAPNANYNFPSANGLLSAIFSYNNETVLSYISSKSTDTTLLGFFINTNNNGYIESWDIVADDLSGDSSAARIAEILSCNLISCLPFEGDDLQTALDSEGFYTNFVSDTPGTWSGPVDLSVTEILEPTSLSLVVFALCALGCCTFLRHGRGCKI